jgi:antitoxin component of MazEF toxin-antitoxin module
MLQRKAFKTGHCLAFAIPKKYAEALKILPGTWLTVTLENRAIHISRAIVASESSYAGAVPADAGGPVREKGV